MSLYHQSHIGIWIIREIKRPGTPQKVLSKISFVKNLYLGGIILANQFTNTGRKSCTIPTAVAKNKIAKSIPTTISIKRLYQDSDLNKFPYFNIPIALPNLEEVSGGV
jgi:hypothetical protein|tara:strand:+ start:159 stop:482 length:324 start_codon:yes stop_codon:yes gene_type:complete